MELVDTPCPMDRSMEEAGPNFHLENLLDMPGEMYFRCIATFGLADHRVLGWGLVLCVHRFSCSCPRQSTACEEP